MYFVSTAVSDDQSPSENMWGTQDELSPPN
jgi:hypothetical protein